MAIHKDDIIGMKFGKLTVISYSHNYEKKHFYNCICECGGTKVCQRSSLMGGSLSSCGCLASKNKNKKYKKSIRDKIPSELFNEEIFEKCKRTLKGMKYRCYNKYNSGYKNYGERGITVCDEWHGDEGFINFYYWSLNNNIETNLSIDRIDVNGNYEPSNCRWVTVQEQNDNKTTSIFIEYNGEIKMAKDWSIIKNIPYGTILKRYKKGINGEELFKLQNKQFGDMKFKFKKETKTFREWAKIYKVSLIRLKQVYEEEDINEFMKKEPSFRNDGVYKKIEDLEEKIDYLTDTVNKLLNILESDYKIQK